MWSKGNIAIEFGVGLLESKIKPKPLHTKPFKNQLGLFSCVVCDGTYEKQQISHTDQDGAISPKKKNQINLLCVGMLFTLFMILLITLLKIKDL